MSIRTSLKNCIKTEATAPERFMTKALPGSHSTHGNPVGIHSVHTAMTTTERILA